MIRNDILGLEMIEIKELEPFQGELKSLSKANYRKLRKQIETLGFSEPVAVWKNEGKNFILNGHQRVRTLQAMAQDGVDVPKIPAVLVKAKDRAEAKRKVLALTSQYGEMSDQGLMEFMAEAGIEWPEVKDGFRFPEIDFKRMEADWFDKEIVEDEVPEPPKVAITKRGDLWQLGDHLLSCGDSTSEEAIRVCKPSDMVFTDPPYGVDYEKKATDILGRKDRAVIAGDSGGKEVLETTVRKAFENIHALLNDGGAYYVCSPQGGELGLMMMMMMMMQAGVPCRHMIVWVKDSPVFSMGRLDYDYQHEPILYGWKGSHKHVGLGRFRTSVWQVPRPKVSKIHPTMKPVELVANAIKNSIEPGKVVSDLFGGSGTTLIAAEQTNTRARILEIDPIYCDVIIERWEKLTGKSAIRTIGDQTERQKAEASRKRLEAKGVFV